MLVCIELSELIIYCQYARKFLVFEVIYYVFLFYTFLPVHSSSTYERYTNPENLGFCYQPIRMPNNITRQY